MQTCSLKGLQKLAFFPFQKCNVFSPKLASSILWLPMLSYPVAAYPVYSIKYRTPPFSLEYYLCFCQNPTTTHLTLYRPTPIQPMLDREANRILKTVILKLFPQ